MTQPRAAEPEHVPVLIVGGGPVGLTASVALSRLGVRSLLIERHGGTSRHPKARGVDVRTMEIFRQWGLEAHVRAAGLPAEEHGFFFRAPTLTSPVFERFGGGGRSDDARRLSPASWLVIGQDALEPVLLERTRAMGRGEVRFGHELVALDTAATADAATGVSATILDRERGEVREVRASFVLGADGAGSRTRSALGIGLDGRGPLVANASILFRADLAAAVADRHSAVYYLVADPSARPRGYPMSVGNPPDGGVILTIDGRERWLLVVGLPVADAPPPSDADAVALVRRAAGIPDLELEILGVLPWTPAARVAATYRRGGAFLAGDAAHEMTPSGAFGLNVGIQDAANLAWKLAAVLSGWAGPPLLDTYDAERRPVARVAAEQSYLQFAGLQPPRPFGNWGIILGPRYESAAVVSDGTAPPDVDDPAADYVPIARPGHRMPHAWLGMGEGRRSTHDVLGPGFTLLTRESGWAAAADAVAADLAVPLASRVLAGALAPEDDETFEAPFGIGPSGAVIVRPDGYVGWRLAVAEESAPTSDRHRRAALSAALRRLAAREG